MTAGMHAYAAPPTNGQTFNWLLVNFVRNTDGVRDAVAVSSDGLLIAASEGLERASADQLAAIVSGMTGLARSASRRLPEILTTVTGTGAAVRETTVTRPSLESLFIRLTGKELRE